MEFLEAENDLQILDVETNTIARNEVPKLSVEMDCPEEIKSIKEQYKVSKPHKKGKKKKRTDPSSLHKCVIDSPDYAIGFIYEKKDICGRVSWETNFELADSEKFRKVCLANQLHDFVFIPVYVNEVNFSANEEYFFDSIRHINSSSPGRRIFDDSSSRVFDRLHFSTLEGMDPKQWQRYESCRMALHVCLFLMHKIIVAMFIDPSKNEKKLEKEITCLFYLARLCKRMIEEFPVFQIIITDNTLSFHNKRSSAPQLEKLHDYSDIGLLFLTSGFSHISEENQVLSINKSFFKEFAIRQRYFINKKYPGLVSKSDEEIFSNSFFLSQNSWRIYSTISFINGIIMSPELYRGHFNIISSRLISDLKKTVLNVLEMYDFSGFCNLTPKLSVNSQEFLCLVK